ncbi:aspartic proteinase Asp1-like isoform X2 [Alnus glutinosa]|uniref:aspartic proteinase Asp1-like isoform X2 n=1 Tax=Alnus glutinosa TaxID=3517 RepID=UPI002D787ACF|nr:aspartic proteinase Asp1-like isoform X2 [Alnus glutinosa]
MKGQKVVVVLVLLPVLMLVLAAYVHSRRKSMLTKPTSSLLLNRVGSSVMFPLYGNVYPIGFYKVTLNIGQPSKPYFLDPDTGSDLTWLQCDAPCVRCTESPHPLYRPNNLVVCRDPLCQALNPYGEHRCETPEQCDYEVQYADGSSSIGVLLEEVFSIDLTNGMQLKPHLPLGCGYDQMSNPASHPLDGVLGLGKGQSSIVSQLSRQGLVRKHCLSGRGGGYLFFGDGPYDSSRVLWTSMSHDHPQHYSSAGFAELIFGGKTTGIKNLVLVFDSGSSYTYLNSQAYQVLTSLVKRELSGKPLTEELDDKILPICWRGRKPFKSLKDVRKYFKPLALSFINGGKAKIQFELPPEAYLIISTYQCKIRWLSTITRSS